MATWHAIDSQGLRSARVIEGRIVFQLEPRSGEQRRGLWTQSCSHRAFLGGQFHDSVTRIFGPGFLEQMLDVTREALAERKRVSAQRRRETKRAPRARPLEHLS